MVENGERILKEIGCEGNATCSQGNRTEVVEGVTYRFSFCHSSSERPSVKMCKPERHRHGKGPSSRPAATEGPEVVLPERQVSLPQPDSEAETELCDREEPQWVSPYHLCTIVLTKNKW